MRCKLYEFTTSNYYYLVGTLIECLCVEWLLPNIYMNNAIVQKKKEQRHRSNPFFKRKNSAIEICPWPEADADSDHCKKSEPTVLITKNASRNLRFVLLATQTKLVTESENCWRALAWNPALNICKPLVHRKCWAKRKPLECHLLVSESNPSFRKCSSIKCFEVRKRLYGHQHDAQRSDPIFNIAQLKEASEENKTDSGE
ncbi:hypothetical protein YC2023_025015 [Brassica napus]